MGMVEEAIERLQAIRPDDEMYWLQLELERQKKRADEWRYTFFFFTAIYLISLALIFMA